uniref:Uncharacterized protein n=1 Tax=Arundo donax TaxID=35708 RepID=A0A0A9D5A4_ARUDO
MMWILLSLLCLQIGGVSRMDICLPHWRELTTKCHLRSTQVLYKMWNIKMSMKLDTSHQGVNACAVNVHEGGHMKIMTREEWILFGRNLLKQSG